MIVEEILIEHKKQIVKEYLQENGFDGLCSRRTGCECHLDDLFYCEEYWEDCEPGYYDEYGFHIVPEKKEREV